LYGYSWDMMVHSWHTQHIKITFIDKKTNETHFLNPKAWTTRRRWSSHADMIKQYAECIEKKLYAANYTDIELYMDVWRSMNHRFNQRQLDPRIDLTKAEWNPFKKTEWLMPLLTDLSSWRSKLIEIENKFEKEHSQYDLTFVADFNGLKLENYVSVYLNTTIEVLNGLINVEFDKFITNDENNKKIRIKQNVTLQPGERLNVPSGAFHNVYTISKEPSCYMYIYVNETALEVSKLYNRFLINMMKEYNRTYENLIETEKDKENLTYKALNLTLQRNSNDFLHMISFNESQTLTENEQELDKIQKMFEKRNLNFIYNQFNVYFRSHVKHTLIIDKLGVFQKIFHKVWPNLLRFKHR
jgi:hypothetical protein